MCFSTPQASLYRRRVGVGVRVIVSRTFKDAPAFDRACESKCVNDYDDNLHGVEGRKKGEMTCTQT